MNNKINSGISFDCCCCTADEESRGVVAVVRDSGVVCLCDNMFLSTPGHGYYSKIETVVHEISHLCGTEDVIKDGKKVYDDKGCKDLSPDEKVTNAAYYQHYFRVSPSK